MPTTGTETGDITGLHILDPDGDTSLNIGTLTRSHMDMAIPLDLGSLARDLLMLSQRPRLMLMPTTGTETGDITGPHILDPDGDTSLDIGTLTSSHMGMAILHGITRDKNLHLVQMTSK